MVLVNTNENFKFFIQVHRAYDILVGNINVDSNSSKEKGYVASLYNGIKRCPVNKHIHVDFESDYIMHLITRAEPELQGRFVC